MAVPKKKVSPGRKKMRRQFYELTPTAFVSCPNCADLRRPHRICSSCGFYNGRLVVAQKTKAKAESTPAA